MWRLAQPGKPLAALKIASLPVAVAALAACAGTAGNTGGQGNSSTSPAPDTVSVHDVSGLGPALVDGAGKTAYFSAQEADGTVHCVQDCLNFWLPVPATQDPGGQVPGLGSVQRPDNGLKQLTYQGKPLYTFSMDGAGGHAGDNVSDQFAGQQFTWHAAVTSAGPASPAPTSSGSGGYGY